MGKRDNRATFNEYHRKWLQRRRLERRIKLLALLGGKCVRCDSHSELEFDHIDPRTKKFKISGNEHFAWDRLVAEVKKCRLLCVDCHGDRTGKQARDRARRRAAS